jgi:hypothetical protein
VLVFHQKVFLVQVLAIAFDPRTVGTQMDDSIMQKNLAARILIKDKKYLLSVKSKVLDGRIF